MKKPKREPPSLPTKAGDRIIKRGRPTKGVVMEIHPKYHDWVYTEWDDGGGPKLCHRYELEKIS